MEQKKFLICFVFIFISVHASVLTNLCSNISSCNCTVTNNTNLEIVCNSTLSLSQLPIIINNTLRTSITYLHISSLIAGTPGPLITLPTNICLSYPNIAILNLSSNAITGFLNTSELACLGSNLINVDFSNNFINDIDINFFKANRNLQIINLSKNNLTTMPTIDAANFINFISTITLMNFSYNQITNVDFWPLFVRTQNSMTIDMSHNLITNYTNNIPVDINQYTNTPDPRTLYLNNNQLNRLSDLLLEQYGACSTVSFTSTAYFVVGISNVLLTNNPLICDCESYNLVTYINEHLSDFRLISSGTALLTQAKCTLPLSTNGQSYIFSNFTNSNSCENYTLPSISDAFCSVYPNATISTLSPPTYWPSTITTTAILTTIINQNVTTTEPGGGGGGNSGSNTNTSNANSSKTSSSPSWYIILGIVLGLVLILFLIILGIFLCKDRLLPEKCRSKLRNNDTNPDNSYERISRHSELSSKTTFPLNGIKPHRTSTCGIDDQDKRMLQLDDLTLPNGHHSWSDKIHPEQETQTCFQIVRSKPSAGQTRSTRDPQRIINNNNNIPENPRRERKKSSSTTSNNITTNSTNGIKGIPISSVPTKNSSIFSIENETIPDTSTSELSVTSIPLTPSRRAKILPQLKSGIYVDSTNKNLLNISASALIENQRQRRRSSIWTQNQYQNIITPPPARPQSMIAQKTIFNEDDSSDDERSSIPTVEILTNKSSKPLRTLPLLNITVIPAWIDDPTDQK